MQDHTPEQIDQVVTAAATAAEAWATAGGEARAALLRALADALEAERGTLVPLADAETVAVLQAVQGSLTVTLWGAEADTADNRRLTRAAEGLAARVLFAGVPTGVAVTVAQQHGGPWPASTQAFTTSVGCAALERFLRPVALQDAPAWLVAAKEQA